MLPVQSREVGQGGTETCCQYFENCWIQGDIDFIFGPYCCWFESCVIVCNNRHESVNGYYTAANTPQEETVRIHISSVPPYKRRLRGRDGVSRPSLARVCENGFY